MVGVAPSRRLDGLNSEFVDAFRQGRLFLIPKFDFDFHSRKRSRLTGAGLTGI